MHIALPKVSAFTYFPERNGFSFFYSENSEMFWIRFGDFNDPKNVTHKSSHHFEFETNVAQQSIEFCMPCTNNANTFECMREKRTMNTRDQMQREKRNFPWWTKFPVLMKTLNEYTPNTECEPRCSWSNLTIVLKWTTKIINETYLQRTTIWVRTTWWGFKILFIRFQNPSYTWNMNRWQGDVKIWIRALLSDN